MTIDYYGDQATKIVAVPPQPLSPVDQQFLRIRRATYTVPTGGIAVSKGIALFKIFAGEIFLGVDIAAESGALDTGAILQLGDGTTVDLYGEGSANDGDLTLGTTYATKYGTVITTTGWIVLQCKAASAGLVAAKTINAVLKYGSGGV